MTTTTDLAGELIAACNREPTSGQTARFVPSGSALITPQGRRPTLAEVILATAAGDDELLMDLVDALIYAARGDAVAAVQQAQRTLPAIARKFAATEEAHA